jgi:hypothetical protein
VGLSFEILKVLQQHHSCSKTAQYRRGSGLHDAADHDSVGEHVVIVIASGLPMSVSG